MDQQEELICVLATEDDIPDIVELWFAAWVGTSFHDTVWGGDTQANRHNVAERLREKWRSSPNIFVVKGIEVKTNKMLSFCLWEIVGTRQSREEALREDPLTTGDWLEGEDREVARQYLVPPIEMRWDIMQGQPFALLMYLTTAPHARRRGAAKILVEWGQAKAASQGIPAYCEASDMGLNLYLKCGFKTVAMVQSFIGGKLVDACPALKWTPPEVK